MAREYGDYQQATEGGQVAWYIQVYKVGCSRIPPPEGPTRYLTPGKHSAADVHDSKMLKEAVDTVQPIHGPRDRPGEHASARRSFPPPKATATFRAARRPLEEEGHHPALQ